MSKWIGKGGRRTVTANLVEAVDQSIVNRSGQEYPKDLMCAPKAPSSATGTHRLKTSRRPPPSSRRDTRQNGDRACLLHFAAPVAVRPYGQPPNEGPGRQNSTALSLITSSTRAPLPGDHQSRPNRPTSGGSSWCWCALLATVTSGEHEHGQRARGHRSEAWLTEQHEG